MIHLILGGICAYWGISAGLGTSTLLRPLLDAVSPLPPASIAMLCTIASLAAALIHAFFMLSSPLALHQDELILLAVGGALGGVAGDLISVRFFAMLGQNSATFLQNALLFTLLALPAIYFSTLARSLRPLSITRMASLPAAFLIGIAAAFLSFGAQPLTLMAYALLFGADEEECTLAALTVALTAMAGKLVCLLIREHFSLPDVSELLWLLPGTMLGVLIAIFPALRMRKAIDGRTLLRVSLYTAALNMAAALA